ncbi:homogentisate phytyltransferase [Calothrix sp. UHCC 0171]|uniref:homogentisate phytyltransferase n=1 Tax=Calothrix sp. UHCC 0171 TaxID=3110245 RepID=UPI002B21C088|nr:homogentisate phytyltransferase [Calothrix sp. UHCC 0171]MEA5570540.1 homogentisate phytyltransferase [Calothrix sp. UHCC 0171]
MSNVFGLQSQGAWLYSLWKFSRPHTIIGTTLSALGLYLIAIGLADASFTVIPLLGAWIACLCGNVYIVGLNQLEDIAIDKINKPHLPLASGDFSLLTGKLIVAITGVLALIIAMTQGKYLFGMVAVSLAIGTAYSLPPIRLKRFPFWAAICIFSVRGAIVNLGLYLHYNSLFQQTINIPNIPVSVWLLTVFVIVFTFAIAIFKDIPDMEGDAQYNISTLSIKLGKESVFKLSLWVITVCYLGIIFAGLLQITGINSNFLIFSHIIPLVAMWWRSQQVNLEDRISIASFYQFIWKLFFLEYLIFPVACLLD